MMFSLEGNDMEGGNKLLVGAITAMAKCYKALPVKPFSSLLQKRYQTFLSAGDRVVVKKVDGIWYELDLKEVIDSAIFYDGSREPETMRALKLLCSPGDVVFDIGANIGSMAIPIAAQVASLGKVYAFEPVPWAINKFNRNIELNDFSNIVVESIALSDESQSEVELDLRASFKIESSSGVGEAGDIDDSWWKECDRVVVPVETLDSYVKREKIVRLDLIKLDVDGFEGKVIRGGLNTLTKFQPKVIMEVAPAWIKMRGDNIRNVLTQLVDIGYDFYMETNFEKIEDIHNLIESLPSGGGFNVIASTKELAFPIR